MIEGIGAAGDALNEWFWSERASLPEGVEDLIRPLLGMTRSPVDAAVTCSEVIYAWRSQMSPASLALGADLARLCAENGYHQMDQDSRGDRLARLMSGQTIPEADVPAPRYNQAVEV